MPHIISKPPAEPAVAKGCNEAHRFAYYETRGGKGSQEDTLVWKTFEEGELDGLTSEQIGYRLWTTYQKLLALAHERYGDRSPGTTACTTIINGEDLITANLADAVAFAVIYDAAGAVISVQRLNKRTHKPRDPEEKARIETAGGEVFSLGLAGPGFRSLALSRAIGDFEYKGICADADINITTLPKDAHHVQIITTCDGFTDGAGRENQTKEGHETYLKNTLNAMNGSKPGKLAESIVAEGLANRAIGDGSKDNISIAVQSIKTEGRPATQKTMMGVYDGHGGTLLSHFVADHIGIELTKQLRLTASEYETQPESVQSKRAIYDRDHSTPGAGIAVGAGAGAGAGVGLRAGAIKDSSSSPVSTTSPPPRRMDSPTTASKKPNPMSEELEKSHASLMRHIDAFLESMPTNRYNNLKVAVTTLRTSLTSAATALKEEDINLQTYGAHCKTAIRNCEDVFKEFRGESSFYRNYFGPLVRKFLSCFGAAYQEERKLDLQVASSRSRFSMFEREIDIKTAEGKKGVGDTHNVRNPLRK